MPLTTLIVDDEPLAREGLRLLLSQDSEVSDIQEARDGLHAVACIRESRPDLVLLDVQMPEMDGFSVVREVGASLMPPVVFVTAHDQYAIEALRSTPSTTSSSPSPRRDSEKPWSGPNCA